MPTFTLEQISLHLSPNRIYNCDGAGMHGQAILCLAKALAEPRFAEVRIWVESPVTEASIAKALDSARKAGKVSFKELSISEPGMDREVFNYGLAGLRASSPMTNPSRHRTTLQAKLTCQKKFPRGKKR